MAIGGHESALGKVLDTALLLMIEVGGASSGL